MSDVNDPYDILKNILAPVNGPFEPSWNSLKNYRAPRWFTDSKFGIFIHWGLYSVPAFGNEWYPRNMYIPGTPEHEFHVKNFGPLTQFGYKDFFPMFTAENWDPDEWVRLFDKIGARFIVITAEHHDGVALWDSSYTRWSTARMGPKIDIVKELKLATERRGLIFGVSYHRAEHWWFFEPGMHIDSDVRDPRYFDLYGPAKPASMDPRAPPGPDNVYPDHDFLMDWLLRLVEIVERYRPWLIYFDWWIANPAFEPYLRAFAAYYYNRCYSWGIEPVIVYKHGAFPEGTAVHDLAERGTIAKARDSTWLADTSIDKKSWGYVRNAEYKSPKTLIQHLVDVVSKNGVFMLNIGPKSDGSIPSEQKGILLNIGTWLSLYGEAIYGSKPWKICCEGSTITAEGSFTEEQFVFSSKDIRYIVKSVYPLGKAIYAIIMDRPENGRITLKAIRNIDGDIIYVHTPLKDVEIKWKLTDQGLEIELPNNNIEIVIPIVIRVLVKTERVENDINL